jgi:proline iminopeptidase
VLVDQRGSGRSRPHAALEHNTTWHLIDDMELLRQRLAIDRWLVFGGSWGSTLGLAYAEQHAVAVSGLILRGIFLLRQSELRWFYQYGAGELFPEQWAQFADFIPPHERDDMLAAYHRRLNADDHEIRLEAARRWSVWEASTSSMYPNRDREAAFGTDDFALALARIEAHYFVNNGFFESETQLLDGIDRIRQLPAVIVQGRYDVVCPPVTAIALAQRWPEARLKIIQDAGHSAFEPGIASELIAATDRFAHQGRL